MFTRIEIPKERKIDKLSRGRNNWFGLRKLNVYLSTDPTGDPTKDLWNKGRPILRIEGFSAGQDRKTRTPPVVLSLSIQDAEHLGAEILKAALTQASSLNIQQVTRALREILAKIEGEAAVECGNCDFTGTLDETSVRLSARHCPDCGSSEINVQESRPFVKSVDDPQVHRVRGL